jgi:hypothetical protein
MLQYSQIGIRHCNVVYLRIIVTVYTSILCIHKYISAYINIQGVHANVLIVCTVVHKFPSLVFSTGDRIRSICMQFCTTTYISMFSM